MKDEKNEIQTVKIFVASSGELKNERKELVHIVHSTNKIFDHLKLDVVEWETDLPSGSYRKRSIQQEINPLLEDSKIVIVIFFSKVGKFTLNEYKLALKRKKKLFLYFKQGFSPITSDESLNHSKVLELKEQVDEENQVLYQPFKSMDEFRLSVKDDLLLYLKKAYPPPLVSPSEKTEAPQERVLKTDLPCPYLGLSAFQEKDAHLFYGREAATKTLLDLLEGATVTTVLGASGSGKSSLVFAGLVPKLKEKQKWLVVTFRPGDHPLHSLCACLTTMLYTDLDEIDLLAKTGKLVKALMNGEFQLEEIFESILKKYHDQNVLLIADQFEELYTLPEVTIKEEEVIECDYRNPNYFLDKLLEAVKCRPSNARQSLKLVFTLRADFLGKALSNRQFADILQQSDFKLGAMTKDEMQRAIELPAKSLGVSFADGLTNRLIEKVTGRAGDLPLLQFTLTSMWKDRESDKLDHELYQSIGCIENVLASYADHVFEKLDKEEKTIAKRIFLKLVRFGKGTENTRRIAAESELDEGYWQLVTRLADARLVVTKRSQVTGENIVEVIHEALITHWQRLRKWIESDRNFLSWQERISDHIALWKKLDNDAGCLLRGAMLEEAKKWVRLRTEDIGNEGKKYIEASRLNAIQENELKENATTMIAKRYLANMSQEFRTPLTLIIGPLEQMIDDCRDKQDQKMLGTMLRNAQRLLTLVNRSLRQSGNESGKERLHASYQNIVPFIKGILESFDFLALQNKLLLSFYCQQSYIALYFDVDKIEELFYNLLFNAFKYTPAGGKIAASLSYAQGGSCNNSEQSSIADSHSDFVKISIQDTGVGISPEELPRVFDRVHQVENDKQQNNKGTGVGLALSKEIVHLHHGKIVVHSQVGKGATFDVFLPLGRGHLEHDEVVSSPTSPFTPQKKYEMEYGYLSSDQNRELEIEDENKNVNEPGGIGVDRGEDEYQELAQPKNVVLVVEDNVEVREYIRDILRPTYRVVEAGDGREGIARAKEIIPDLIISGVLMPHVDGYELCKTLKNHINTNHIPIMLLSIKASEDNILEGLDTRADDYMTKPFNSKILLSRIDNLIQLRRQMQLKIQRKNMLLPGKIKMTSEVDKFLRELKDIIYENISDPKFGVEQLCKKLFIGPSTLYRKVEALTGEKPNQFIQSYRLEQGAQLLREGYRSVTDVAHAVGFLSSQYFAKCFKEKYKQTPSEYQASEGTS